MRIIDLGSHRLARLLGDLELYWAVRLELHNHSAREGGLALRDVANPQAHY